MRGKTWLFVLLSKIFEAYFPIFEYAEHYNHDEFANQVISFVALGSVPAQTMQKGNTSMKQV